MGRLDRALAIVLLLRDGSSRSATELGRRFEVSPRTIYRDVEALSADGVPVYADMGRNGGFRLLPGYFLPPVMFAVGEAVTLLLGVTLLKSLRARPFAGELETAEHKLLAAVPEHLRTILAETRKVVGFESAPDDAFHREVAAASEQRATHTNKEEPRPESETESQVVSTFLRAIIDRRTVSFSYRSPYRPASERLIVEPLGLFWDRGRWYLVGQRSGQSEQERIWRADRVSSIKPRAIACQANADFDVRKLLDRAWLGKAMADWSNESPVRVRLTRKQAERLRQDWYYRYASYEDLADGQVLLTFGEDNRDAVLELVRWLGPGAELLAPDEWRAALKAELEQMVADSTPAGP